MIRFDQVWKSGMISQIASVIYVVSLARTRRIQTPIATYSVHHVQPAFFRGFEVVGGGIKMATPEKALVDFLYLGPVKSKWFCALPELTLPEDFDKEKALFWVDKIPGKARRTFVSERLGKYIDARD